MFTWNKVGGVQALTGCDRQVATTTRTGGKYPTKKREVGIGGIKGEGVMGLIISRKGLSGNGGIRLLLGNL